MTAKQIIEAIEKKGWYLDRVNGGHYIYKHNVYTGMVVVPYHGGDIPKGTLSNIKKTARLK